MATYKVRGIAHNIIYPYRTEDGKLKQQWETYATELEAMHRKAYIDYLQKNRLHHEIRKAAAEYQCRRAVERAVVERFRPKTPEETPSHAAEDNTSKTYREFVEKWLPIHARKERFSPNSYDSYRSNLERHILPYFGDRVMSSITAEDIDDFLDALSRKPCRGPKSYGKRLEDIPTLSSSTVKKCFTILTSGFETARKWHYITEIPKVTAPTEKTVKRRAWDAHRVFEVLDSIREDELLHLAVHLAFVCSLRAGETAGIDLQTIDLRDGSLWITRQIQRVSDNAISVLPRQEVLRIFPKQVATSRSSLILKGPKTEDSHRKQYLTTPLLEELRQRIARIEENKAFFRDEYQDYGLLICQADGRPVDPRNLEKSFKEHQKRIGIPENERIDFQGLRKSGQMHKVRLSQNNYQLVAENAGQSPEVLMAHYNEVLDCEKRALSRLVEDSFYPQREKTEETPDSADVSALMAQIQQSPELYRKLLQVLTPGAQQHA